MINPRPQYTVQDIDNMFSLASTQYKNCKQAILNQAAREYKKNGFSVEGNLYIRGQCLDNYTLQEIRKALNEIDAESHNFTVSYSEAYENTRQTVTFKPKR